MIIGRDLMRKLKMDVLYSSEAIVWDGLRLPMQEVKNNFMDFNAIIEDTTESDSVKEQMKRMNRILDANYEKPGRNIVDLEALPYMNELYRPNRSV
jgi:hypothetical protein